MDQPAAGGERAATAVVPRCESANSALRRRAFRASNAPPYSSLPPFFPSVVSGVVEHNYADLVVQNLVLSGRHMLLNPQHPPPLSPTHPPQQAPPSPPPAGPWTPVISPQGFTPHDIRVRRTCSLRFFNR